MLLLKITLSHLIKYLKLILLKTLGMPNNKSTKIYKDRNYIFNYIFQKI